MTERCLQDREQLLFVAGERSRDEGGAKLDRQRAAVDRRQIVDHTRLERRAHVGGRGELPLRQPVAAVVFDDVDDRDVPPHQVDELPDPDRPGITVPAHTDRLQRPVRQHGPGPDRRHPAVHRVEAVSGAEEVRRALARAADARQLDDVPRIDPHLEERVDDSLRDGVVAAAGAQRRLAPAIRLDVQPDAIQLPDGFRCCGFHDYFSTGGLRPAGPPIAVARGGPFAPLRSGGGAPGLLRRRRWPAAAPPYGLPGPGFHP